jgi:dihydrofolate synthase/folylpolyglutamate synthase
VSLTASNADYAAARDYLLGLKKRGVSMGLDRMRRFADALGDPQGRVPCIHIAGTNGKGSVAAMLESIFRTAGWRTGLYTSPHLVRLGERIQVDRQPLGPGAIAAYVQEMRPIASRLEVECGEDAHPSYFEFMTAMAFAHFARERCDIACIEVGLGGRLDATNIVTPEVSVITSIGFDHCDVLGCTLADIASEKGGIIKAGRPVVLGRLPAEAESTLREIALSRDCAIYSVREEFGDDLSRYPETNLVGDYQRWNAATAMLVARVLPTRWRLTAERIQVALLNVQWSARWQEFIVGHRRVILDTAHNSEGAESLDQNLSRLVATIGRAPLVVGGALGLSRARPLVEVFCRHAREIHFVVPAQSRACRFEELQSVVPADYSGKIVRDTVDRIFPSADVCTIGEAGDTVVVAGSVYLAGEVLARIEPGHGPSESRLQDF